jgi:SpoVK/Ycf46/Vps4 family AAA+-type ATPase
MTEIVAHQWGSGIRRRAIKGFLLSGPPGIGKTSLALRVAYELSLRFADPSPDGPPDGEVVLTLIDGGDIARSRYGESEERLREVFARAQKGFTSPNQRTIVLFDDVESILMARGKATPRSGTSRGTASSSIRWTSWTPAGPPSSWPAITPTSWTTPSGTAFWPTPWEPRTWTSWWRSRRVAPRSTSFTDAQLDRLSRRIEAEAEAGGVRSVREAERMVVRQYIEDVLGRTSMAQLGEA